MKEKIRVIHYSDVDDYLSHLLKENTINVGDLVCACCRTAITASNFGGVARLGNKITFSCNNESCLLGLTVANMETRECR